MRQYLEDPRRRHRQPAVRARAEARDERRENRSRHDLTSARLGGDGRLVAAQLDPFLERRARPSLAAAARRVLGAGWMAKRMKAIR